MRRDFIILFLLAVVLFGVNNTFIPADIMESRNLVSAREMVESGEWLIPSLNGNVRLEKPPLPTWGAAVVETVCPHNIMAQRALSAFMAWLLIWFVYLAVVEWRHNRSLALMTSAVLASCYSLMFMARNATWDIWAQAFCMGGIWLYMRSVLRRGAQTAGFIGAGLMFGLSFMSKGPVALYGLLLPFLIAFHLMERPSMKGKWRGLLIAVLLTVLVGSWWYVYIYICVKGQAQAIVGKETAAWSNHNVRPWYYYKLFFVEAGIWSLFWLTALIDGWRYKRSRPLRTALVWSLAALVLLSLMPEKKTRYLLPMMVPCAMSVAFYLRRLAEGHFRSLPDRRALQLNVGILVVLLFVLSGGALYLAFLRDAIPIFGTVPVVVCFILLAAFLSRELMPGGQRVGYIVAGCVGIMMAICIFCFRLVEQVILNPNYKSVSVLSEDKTLRDMPFVWPEDKELRPEVMLQARRVIRLVSPSDTAAVKRNAPFVLLSSLPLDSFSLPHDAEARALGRYDMNWGRGASHHRRDKLVVNAWRVEMKASRKTPDVTIKSEKQK